MLRAPIQAGLPTPLSFWVGAHPVASAAITLRIRTRL